MDKCVSLPVLTTWLYSLSDEEFEKAAGHPKKGHPRGTDDEFNVAYFLSEAAPKFETWLKEQGLFLEEMGKAGMYLHYNPDNFENINIACQAILADYDGDFETLRQLGCFPPYRNEDGSPAEGTPWQKWNLGGDDDVDYNGGYITTVLDLLVAYEKKEPV